MKYLIILMLITFNAHAETPYFTHGDPGIIVKAGVNPALGKTYTVAVIEFETGLCQNYKHCFNPLIASIEREEAIGFDYVYRAFKYKDLGAVRLSAGYVRTKEPVNGDNENIVHIGAGVEIFATKDFGALITIDQYLTDRPIGVIGIGLHWR